MSFNLMEMVQGVISDKTLASVGGILGTDQQATSDAIGATLPALIGGLMKKTSTSEGASEVFGLLDKADGGMLDDLGGMFDGGEKQNGLLSSGQDLLKMIFGGGLSGMLGAIGKITGLKSGSIGSLLSILAPIVMGILGKQKQAEGWDIGGFTSAISGQKEFLADMDPGLVESPGVGNMVGAAKDNVVAKATDTGRAVSGGVDKAAVGGGNLLKLALPLILLAALAFVAWRVLFSGGETVTDPVTTNTPTAETNSNGMVDTEITVILRQTFAGINKAIASVTDEASAQTAADKISELAPEIDALDLGSLSGARKNLIVAPVVKRFRRGVNRALENTYEIPGVEAKLKPVMDGVLDKLSSFAD